MSLRINHNIDSMVGHTNLLRNTNDMSQSLARLSSGLKINSAADDPAGLVISEQMRAQIAGLNQAVNNSEAAVSMVQTAEGALDEVNSLLTKARQLVLDAANSGVNDTNQIAADQAELDNVIQSITRISEFTQFGTKKLLDGSLNGASSLVNVSHVRVGNLANNPSISTGTVNMVVTAGTRESLALRGGLGTDSYIFSGTVTGVSLGTKRVMSGVTVSLAIDGRTVSFVTSGTMNASNVASKLDNLVANLGFSVTANSGGEMVVNRDTVGSTDFLSRVTYTRGPTAAVLGVNEKVTSFLKVTPPSTNAGAASVIFSGVTLLSGVQNASVVNGGTVFSYTLQTATGAVYVGNVAVATGTTATMDQVLSGLQTSIRSKATFSGSSVTLDGGGASGTFKVGLTRGDNTITTDFNFSLTVDYLNTPASNSHAEVLNLATSTFQTGAVSQATFSTGAAGTTAVQGNALVATSYLLPGNAIDLTISGVTLIFTGGRTLSALATAMQSAVNSLGSDFANLRVAFGNAATTYSGLPGAINITGAIGGGFRGFVVYSVDGNPMSVSLRVDQKVDLDVAVNGNQTKAGIIGNQTLNLTTVTQQRISGAVAVTAQSGRSVASTSGASVVVSGIDFRAVMTTANGVMLDLVASHVTASGAATLTLTTGSQALGYTNFSAEVGPALVTAGGAASFNLSNGALFQVGPNAGQQVGVTIDSIAATELGRNVEGAGTLLSLNDLLSTQKGALINGQMTEALRVIDATIDQITNLRGFLGALQANALDSGLNSLRVSQQNLTSAESTIRDVDFAAESAIFSRNQILVQSATSMLAQANQLPQSVLKLVGG